MRLTQERHTTQELLFGNQMLKFWCGKRKPDFEDLYGKPAVHLNIPR